MTEKAEKAEPIPTLVRSISAGTKLATMTTTMDVAVRVEKEPAREFEGDAKGFGEWGPADCETILQVYSFGISRELLDEPLLL
jgi:hypothetical protein